MSQSQLLRKVIETLDNTGIEYMLTGSFVSSIQGEPRATHDIDLLVTIEEASIKKLVAAFPFPQFYLNEDSVTDAINRQDMFNLIDVTEGDKVDFWILTDAPFDLSRFKRKYQTEFIGITLQVSSPEDTILAKLKWAKLSGGSEKQFVDALRIYEVQYNKLDPNYLDFWIKELRLGALWKRLKEEAQVIEL